MRKRVEAEPFGVAVRFRFKNETPGAVRYEEINKDGDVVKGDKVKVGSLYLKKTAFGDAKPPKRLKITIREDMDKEAVL